MYLLGPSPLALQESLPGSVLPALWGEMEGLHAEKVFLAPETSVVGVRLGSSALPLVVIPRFSEGRLEKEKSFLTAVERLDRPHLFLTASYLF